MPDDVLNLPGSLSVFELVAALRYEEELHYKLSSCEINPHTDENNFSFDTTILDPPPANPGDPDLFLKLYPFAQLPADNDARDHCLEDFTAFGGGDIVWHGTIRVASAPTFVVFYRGSDPEFPQPHAESPTAPALPFIPADARRAFDPDQLLADLPLKEASTIRMSLKGLKDSVISYFHNDEGKVDAFVMITDADIDTDGPHGSTQIDPWYQSGTSLKYPGGASCDSRQFPGVVRSVHLREHFGLKLGDFVYIYHNGQAVACQIYDQGPDNKIGEISIYAARIAGIVPPTMSDRAAATKGNSVNDMITLCFPGSCPDNRATDLATINKRAAECLAAFTARLKGQVSTAEAVMAAKPVPVAKPAVATGTAGTGTVQQPTIFLRRAWGALRPKVSSFASAQAEGIVIHNTEDPNRAPLSDEDAERQMAFALSRRIQHSHMVDRRWSDIGQHFTISRGGVIMEARAGTLDAAVLGRVVRGAHAGSSRHNRSWWGIEIEGDFRFDAKQITPAQETALVELCHWLGRFIQGFSPAEHIKAHRQVKPGGTDCPGHLLDSAHSPDFLTRLCQKVGGVVV